MRKKLMNDLSFAKKTVEEQDQIIAELKIKMEADKQQDLNL